MNAQAIASDPANDSTSKPADRNQPKRRWSRLLNGASILVIVVCLMVLARTLPIDRAVQGLQSGISRMGPAGPLVFGAAYIVAVSLFVPGAALTLASGAVFGLFWGTVVVSIASTVAAAFAFLIARYFARGKVQQLARRSPRFGAIDRAIGQGGWKIVALLRLSPAVPYSLGNYLYGLTPIRFWPYVLASWICMLPGTFMYVYIGFIGAEGLAAASSDSAPVSTGKIVLYVLGLVATVVVTVYVTRMARRALKEQTDLAAEPVKPAAESQPKSSGGGSVVRRFALPVVAAIVLAGTVVACTQSAALRSMFGPPAATLQEAYADDASTTTFDHGPFDALMRKHVAAGGWVDYAGLQRDADALSKYIDSLATAPFDDLGRDGKLALLINAYNAFTLRLILDHYPLKSIKDIPDEKRWEAKRWNVAGETWSLNQIEHEQIRPKFREPRIHFALVCAAVGCPPLRPEAYTAKKLEEQLADQTRYIHSHDRWFRFGEQDDVVHLTPLYKWYGGDFEQVAGSVLEFAAKYSPQLQKALDAKRELRIEWLDYDWKLNSRENQP